MVIINIGLHLPSSPVLILPISSGRICQLSEAGLRGRSAMLSTGGEMYSLTPHPPLIRLRAISQRVGDGGLVGRVTVLAGNGDDAFLFWATCSMGTTAVTGGSTGAVGWRDEIPATYGRGRDAKVRYFCLDPFPVVLVGEAGFRLPDGTAPGGLATGFGPPWKLLARLGAGQKTGPPPAVELSVLIPPRPPLACMASSFSSSSSSCLQTAWPCPGYH